MKRKSFMIVTFMVAFAVSAFAQVSKISEVEIKSDPEKDGQRDFTVRILPAVTHKCEEIIFECVYRQQFPWENLQGKKYVKTHEPVAFSYYRHDVRLVADLDKYISFRVPMSMKLLEKAYGDKTFNKDYPVTIGRLKITAKRGKVVLWSYDLEAGGVFKVGAKPITKQ
ncbi:MAG: hypothetical protein KAI74_04585 [Kiritimatiellae bacterium]|nr:hypothetical protein [Kiritimatiellia bacterium]